MQRKDLAPDLFGEGMEVAGVERARFSRPIVPIDDNIFTEKEMALTGIFRRLAKRRFFQSYWSIVWSIEARKCQGKPLTNYFNSSNF